MSVIDEIMDVFSNRGGGLYLGEAVTQMEHALQAAQLAENEGAPASQVAAALLHDIGHIVDLPEDGAFEDSDDRVDDLHEDRGHRWLSAHFGPEVTDLVRLHVPAKRYLCAVDSDYFGKLSEASVKSLKVQGGPMSPDETRAFEAELFYKDAAAVRRWDDAAKVPGLTTPELHHFLPYLESVVSPPAGG